MADEASSKDDVPVAADAASADVDTVAQMAQADVRDPFAKAQPLETESESKTSSPEAAPEIPVELQGIGLGSEGAYAIIGDEIFYKGDTKKGVRLLEVRKRAVDILVGGGTVTLPLFEKEDLARAMDRATKKNAKKKTSEDPLLETPSSLSGREQSPL